jgi:hypothetical protein
MNFIHFSFSDPVFLVLCVVVCLFIAAQLTQSKILERRKVNVELLQTQRDLDLAREDSTFLDEKEIKKVKRLTEIEDDSAYRRLKDASKVHVEEIMAEDDAALRADRERDKQERRKQKNGRVQSRGAEDFIPESAGQGEGAGQSPARGSGPDKKAAPRHRKPQSD